jgi:hypothetical protein
VLLERGAISQAQLEAALFRQKQTRQKLGVVLVQQGLISEDQLAHTLAEALSLPLVDLKTAIDWAAVHLFRPRFCEQHDCFPYSLDRANKRLLLAMADPLNTAAVGEAEFTTGFSVQPVVASVSGVRSAILRAYHKVTGELGPRVSAPLKPAKESSSSLPLVVGVADATPTPTAPMPAVQVNAGSKSLGDELDELLGGATAANDEPNKLERQFWALIRVLSRKGVITREEFHRELEEDSE